MMHKLKPGDACVSSGCQVETVPGKWICLDNGQTVKDCGTTAEGEARSCTCYGTEDGLMITYKTKVGTHVSHPVSVFNFDVNSATRIHSPRHIANQYQYLFYDVIIGPRDV